MTDFDDVLARLQGPLGRLAGGDAGQVPPAPTVRGEGSALDEQVRVVMVGGEFTEVVIDPRAMRLANAQLGQHLLTAFNAALADHTARMAEAMADQIDLGDLQGELAQLRTESLTAMKTYTDSLFDALGQMRRIQRD